MADTPGTLKSRQWLSSFGRRRGRKLPEAKEALLDSLLPKIRIRPDDNTSANSPAILAANYPRIWLEIGFGGGEHLAVQAGNNPDVLCIGCEPYIDGVAKLLSEVDEQSLDNVRIFADDARLVLQELPDESIERLFILFPDPWPKSRHHKRRIVSLPTLEMIWRVLKPGGELRLATDHVDYAAWMLEHVQAHGGFTWQARSAADWKKPAADWVPTRYEAKTRAEGREPVYYSFERNAPRSTGRAN